MIVSVDELRIRIERRLEHLSEQAERMRAALEALGPSDPAPASSTTGKTPRSTGPRERRAPTPGATGNGRALTAAAIPTTSAALPASPATLSDVASEPAALSAEYEDTPPPDATIDQTAGAAEANSTEPATGAVRALHELRSELTAALRNGRS